MGPSSESPTQTLRRLVNGYQVTQAIHVAATLGVAALLRDGPRAAEELAPATESHARYLHRVLRALAEFARLLSACGFALRRVVPTAIGLTVFEARAA